ncbi:MAG: Rne/Rng family ribonuclease, partial [Acidobacteriota bacterium]|nr:Rne/Rng family ribonuclease [Acidobacteriota bacterium]
MPKELIVSVNGREKKIAIIEDGRVTEFYIERGEASQGIVGNIYKGRVMRVLPGMQSAFVDIGLERDAFLYVSDFFDEEEEFERIVIDKTKVEGADAEAAARAATERLERARIERERLIETAQERAEPSLDDDAENPAVEVSLLGPVDSIAPLQPTSASGPTFERNAEAVSDRQRAGRNRQREHRDERPSAQRSSAERPSPQRPVPRTPAAMPPVEAALDVATPERTHAMQAAPTREEIDTPFAIGAASFQRVIDEDEAAAVEEGEMFKDARLQERLFDQIHAIEFDIEDIATAEVGSLLNAGSTSDSSFQRIDDDGEGDAEPTRSNLHSMQRPVAASVARFTDAFTEEVTPGSGSGGSFERISDDEGAEAVIASAGMSGNVSGSTSRTTTPVEEVTTTGRRGRSRRGAKTTEAGSRVVVETNGNEIFSATDALSETPAGDAVGDAPATDETTTTKRRTGRTRAGATATTAGATTKKGAATTEAAAKLASTRGRSKRKPTATADDESEARQKAESSTDVDDTADTEASVTTTRTRGEFARRGGRRRRRSGGNKPATENGDEPRADGGGEEAEPLPEVEEVIVETAAPTPAPEPAANRGRRAPRTEDAGRAPRPADDARAPRPDDGRPARPDDGRAPRNDANRGSRGDNNRGGPRGGAGGGGDDTRPAGGRDRRDRQQPTITDLLREGQEIIVQIAKEPIAAKGARITSHIALPGRFLVYMPTIEHVGVSRKIESDAERVRLRKLIQAITKEEDVPSGGFIVRTAGVGMPESDLRDDARYLVRTWRDIRRAAEKPKAPALVHRDLDLVQRILRDQLSDDFTAIRVDSEEEYLAVVEFINRIQPRLVKRVKLYTREEPILEAFGVQAEIDKAIKPRVWLRSGGYLVINQTEALVAIDVNTGKFVGRGGSRLEDTITRTNLEAVEEIARQVRLRDLGGIIVLDLIDMEERRNRQRVLQVLQEALRDDKSPTKVLSFNDFGLVIMTRKRVKQSLERTLCSPCPYCQGSSLVKSP